MAGAVMDYLFQRSLDDLIKGLRNQTGGSRYVAKAVEEIRKEIKSTDAHTKAVALQKLTYLNMLHGVDMSWAAFNIVEVMSMPKFSHKKIGYMAASQSFSDSTDVLLLTTNLLRKDLSSKNELESGLALGCLSRIATLDLSRDLIMEVFTMLGSSKVHIRKKATIVLLKFFSKYPEGIRVAFKRLVEKLDDPEPQVIGACVTVLYELARQDPQPYLALAPELHSLLVDSTNNWLCLKLVKLFALLMPLEPRLGKKIVDPLCQQMQRTSCKSLIIECIRTVTAGLMEYPRAVELASEKLKEVLNVEDDEDPNLKYLGLQSLLEFLPRHPSLVAENKSVIVKCLNDADPSVQKGALLLILGMVSDVNLVDTVQILIRYARTADKSFCNELVSAILSTCSRAFYELVTDFSWYVEVLGELSRVPHFDQGQEVERQLVDIGLRVESVRPDLFRLARSLLVDTSLWESRQVHRVLAAAAWIAGEYVQFSTDSFEIVEALLQPRLKKLPPAVQAVYLQAVLKALVSFDVNCGSSKLDDDGDQERFEYEEIVDEAQGKNEEESLQRLLALIKENAGGLVTHIDTEVQERASNLFGLINFIEDKSEMSAGDTLVAVRNIFAVEVGPVSQFAQQKVSVPEGLELLDDLDALKDILGESVIVDTSAGGMLFVERKVKVDEPVADESAGLLAQHRQKNEKYYLPKDTRLSSEDYPRAEEPATETQSADDNLKLAEESLIWSKPRRSKPRSVVVKLMDEETPYSKSSKPSTTAKAPLRDTVVSTAIRDALSGKPRSNDVAESSSHPHRSSRRHRKDKQQQGGGCDEVQQEQGGGGEQGDEQVQQQDPKRTSKKHHRKRAKSPLRIAPQAAVVPDFLL